MTNEDGEYWLYLLHYNGCSRVVGEEDNWSVAHQMTGDTGRLFAAAPKMLAALKEAEQALEYFFSRFPVGAFGSRLGVVRDAIAQAEGGDA